MNNRGEIMTISMKETISIATIITLIIASKMKMKTAIAIAITVTVSKTLQQH